ncbi:MAG: efflux RND transporter periplasmic adaptor subunit [Candidatus Paceibacterota bacterium]
MRNFIKKFKKPRYWVTTVIIIAVALFIFLPGEGPIYESEIVARGDVSEIISGTGFVSAEDEVNLSFETSGTVNQVFINEGDSVVRGQILASLDSQILQDEVDSARASLLSQEAQLQEMYAGLSATEEAVAKEKLETAILNLLTSDIEAHFTGDQIEGSIYSYTPPTISGTYKSTEQGEYVIEIYNSNSSSGYSFRYSGLEDGSEEVSIEKPIPLGIRGLYIQFPESFAKGDGVEWTIRIPNIRSSQYTTRRQAYEQALADYNLAKEGSRPEQIQAQEAQVAQARANYQKAQNALSRATLYSPINGVVRSVPTVGENITSAQNAFYILSNSEYHITLYIPESDIANVSIGNTAEVDFIAFSNEIFDAEVGYISPAAEIKDGVTVFKTRLFFNEIDPRVRAGMTADVDIYTETINDAVTIPGRAVYRTDEGNFVRVTNDREIEERQVELGLRGYDGRVEIKSGLEENEEVITFISSEALDELTN